MFDYTQSTAVKKLKLTTREKALGGSEKYLITDVVTGEWFLTIRFEDEWITGPKYPVTQIRDAVKHG